MIVSALFIVVLHLVARIAAFERRTNDPLASCTQTDLALLDACIASQIDNFLVTYENGQPATTFDYNSIASQINGIGNDLTSYGITVSSLVPNPASFTGAATTYAGPYVSDIANSYSRWAATHTGSDGFSFDTSEFLATKTPSSAQVTTRSTRLVTTSARTMTSSSSTATATNSAAIVSKAFSFVSLALGLAVSFSGSLMCYLAHGI